MARVVRPGRIAAVVVLALAGVAAFAFAPGTEVDDVHQVLVRRALAAPHPLSVADDALAYWHEERVRRGDTIGSLLARASVEDVAAMQFLLTSEAARPLYRLRPEQPVRVATDESGELLALRFTTADGRLLTIRRQGNTFDAMQAQPPDDVRITYRAGSIESSLFGAADDVGLPDAMTLKLAEVFAADIDFYHDLRRGDRFVVAYETRYVDGEPVGTGRVVAAEFVNKGVVHHVVLWHGADGGDAYYDENGRSSRNGFLRSPLAFSRITSGFTLARFHPILQMWTAHRGTDFAAPIGTPVHATADGVVAFVGGQMGYGNVIILKHDGPYSTVYAHLSAFAPGLRGGQRVHQGEEIGRVGQTGWATGPHLHYEFRVAGTPRDPMSVTLPVVAALTDAQRTVFLRETAPLLASLEVAAHAPDARVAAAE